MPNEPIDASLEAHRTSEGVLLVDVGGNWRTRLRLPGVDAVRSALEDGPAPSAVTISGARLGAWNSGLLVFIVQCLALCEARGLECRLDGMPEGVRRLIGLSRVVPAVEEAGRKKEAPEPWLRRVGLAAQREAAGGLEALHFLGETLAALGRLCLGRAQFRWSDAWLIIQECGPRALGIVLLINFLVGLILAFVGVIQLRQFGATIYVADLVAIAAVREMGCIMTGVILCGRTGAAFAAQLGTMKVNEEIDAFTSFGISIAEFLVLPRVLALVLMMPLLCVFADLIAIIGGFVVSVAMLDVTAVEYVNRTIDAIKLKSFLLGIFKGAVFGLLVALAGCLRGLQCGHDAAAVGLSTTSAVVTGITSIVVADGLFAVLTTALHL